MIKGRYFSHDELKCKCGKYCGGENRMNLLTLSRLDALREAYGKPINLSSAYRCFGYNEAMGFTQAHATGQSVDIPCSGEDAIEILSLAKKLGFTRFGIKQNGDHNTRFIHIDDLTKSDGYPSPAIWSY